MKAVRTDQELECPEIDAGLRARGVELVTLPDGISEEALMREVADADLLLMCYTPITARVIAAAPKLKGIVKYGVGIDAIDIPAASARGKRHCAMAARSAAGFTGLLSTGTPTARAASRTCGERSAVTRIAGRSAPQRALSAAMTERPLASSRW